MTPRRGDDRDLDEIERLQWTLSEALDDAATALLPLFDAIGAVGAQLAGCLDGVIPAFDDDEPSTSGNAETGTPMRGPI